MVVFRFFSGIFYLLILTAPILLRRPYDPSGEGNDSRIAARDGTKPPQFFATTRPRDQESTAGAARCPGQYAGDTSRKRASTRCRECRAGGDASLAPACRSAKTL